MSTDNNTVVKSTLLDSIDDWSQINDAMSALSQLLAGCSEVNAPPPSVLYCLITMIEKESKAAQERLNRLCG